MDDDFYFFMDDDFYFFNEFEDALDPTDDDDQYNY